MLDTRPIFCQLPTPHISTNNFNRTYPSCPTSTFPKSSFANSNHYDNITCSINNHLRSKYINTVGRHRTKYPDAPKSSRIPDKKRSIFSLKENSKENPTEYIQSKLMEIKEPTSSTHHIGSQTDYREESIQTDPYSPVYTISGVKHPEVFTLSDFTYGKGLPATSIEISFIERLRARREWEQDHKIDMTRTKIVIEREIREWQIRDKEIKMLQDTHHKLFTKNLHTYIEIDEDLTQNILDLSIYRLEKQLKFQHKRLEIDTSRDIRRIKRLYRLRDAQINAVTSYNHLGVIGIAKRGNGCFSSLKPPWHTRSDDIITTFKNMTSKISTPCSNFDYLIDRNINQSRINLFKLEEFLPKNALIAQIDELDRVKILQNNHNKKSSRRIRDLEKAYQLIQKEKTKQLSIVEKKSLRFVEKIERIDDVKQLQTTPIQTEAHHRHRTTIIKFQNYLRSIIVQSKISNVCQIRKDLLIELKNGLKYDQISSLDNPENNNRNQVVSPRTQIYDYLEGATIADMLDFLSKELLRLQTEQTIQIFILLADRYRYQRETAETSSRTRSIEQQKLEDQAFQQMFSLNSNSDIESYLQDLILESISTIANEQARSEIKQITETLVNLTDQITNSSSNETTIEMIVSDLVHHFLFPTVQKISR